jgi:hypothetical protein
MSVTSPEVGTVGLRIALDYDNTYTADNVLWDAFIKLSVSLGHSVYIVTMRSPTLDAIAHALPPEIAAIFYCDGNAKRKYCSEVYGVEFNIWVDDSPEGIYMGSQFTKEQLEEWRLNGRKSI